MNDYVDTSILLWLSQIEQVCADLNNYSVNIIVDQVGDVPSLIQDLERFKPRIDWVSLFEHEPENEFIGDAPVFLQLKIDIWQHREWLSSLLRLYYDPARVLLFFSTDEFNSVAEHLQNLAISEWEGRKGVLRFYDTRVFPVLLESVLNEQQKHYFLSIARFWTWRNRVGLPVWLRSENDFFNFNEIAKINLNDAQFSQIGMVSDIEVFIDKVRSKYPEFTRQSLFEYLWAELQISDEKLPIDTEDFFIECLSRTVK